MKARKHKKSAVANPRPAPAAPSVAMPAGDNSPLNALDWWLIAGLTLFALALRLWRVGLPGFWGDEIHTFMKSAQPLLVILKGDTADLGQFPPLHYVLTHFGILLFGATEWGARLPTVICATAMVPFQYLITRLLAGRRVALLATIVMAVSLYHIYYSRDIHSYGIYACFATISFYFFLRLIYRERQHWGFWIGYTLSTWAMICTHYIGAVACITQALIGGFYVTRMGLRTGRWKAALRLVGWFALAGVLVVLGMAPYIRHLLGVSGGLGAQTYTLEFDAKFFTYTFGVQGFGTGWAMALYVAILLIGTVYALIYNRNNALLIVFWLLFPYLFFAVVKFNYWFHIRRVIFTLPVLVLLWAYGLEALLVLGRRWARNRWWGYAPLAAVVILWAVRMAPAYRDFYSMISNDLTPYKTTAEWMRRNLPEKSIILAENYYDLRWVSNWGFYRVPDRTFAFAAVFDRPEDYLALNMRKRYEDFLTKYPEAAFLYTSIWADKLGLWEWPRTHFRHLQGFENPGGEALAYRGIFHMESFIRFDDPQRLSTWVLFYNTEDDLIAMARARGQKVIRRLTGGFDSVLTRDLHMWLAVAKEGSVTLHQLDTQPRSIRLKVSAVAVRGDRIDLVDPADKVIAQWTLVNGQLHNYETLLPNIPPGKYEVKLRLVSAPLAAAREPALFLIDSITVE